MRSYWPRALAALCAASVCAIFPPAASAAITPALTLDQSAGTHAGSTADLGVDLKFSPGADSPKDLTLGLPPGLLANAAINGGACLNSSTPTPACQVGSGTVSASPIVLGAPTTPISINITYDLIAPPAPGDLAGLAIMTSSGMLGSPGEIAVGPTGAITIAFHDIPDSYPVGAASVPIAVDEINSTFAGLRLPTRCPSPAARLSVSADSYADATSKSASAPLQVTGCAGLPFAPLLKATAVKDSADNGVAITTDVLQGSAQATSRTVGLGFPSAVVSPNAAAVVGDGLLCTSPSLAGCKTIGSAESRSPLYPRTLIGRVYLTGSLTAPAITISFPPPFALTLTGDVDLATNTTTFNGVPDLPLSDLKVALAGGPDAAFATTCATPSGNAVGSFVSQDGDLQASSTAPFTVAGCPGAAAPTSGSAPGGATAVAPLGLPSLAAATITGLRHGRPRISFKLTAAPGAAQLSSVTLPLPRGLAYARHRRHGRLVLAGVTVRGASIKRLSVRHGRLTITLRRPARTVSVTLSRRALRETSALRRAARRGRVRYLKLTVLVTSTDRHRVTLTRAVKPRG